MTWSPSHAFIVSHTHWDREWYLTCEEFRVDMGRVVGRVLDALEKDDGYEHFLLDGQSILLEDHLQHRPDDEPRVRALMEAGRLSVGPWYVLPDEFLVNGESLARNLLHGWRTAAAFGAPHRAGYMPDSFGHVAQMPQILRRAGLDSFIFTRGLGDEAPDLGWRFRWRAPDGTEVLAINQCSGYCNAGGLGFHEIWHAHTRREVDFERAVTQMRELFAKMSERPGAEPALINNGCDHFPPQSDFDAVMDALGEAFPDTTFTHTDLPTFTKAAAADREDLPVHDGELLGGRDHHILSGVWSARMYLKQANARCQDLLARVAEPLAAYARFAHGQRYPDGELRWAWKLLLQNHPHDSICGCSVDGVHRDMTTRFERVERTGERLVIRHLEELAPTFAPRAEDDDATLLCIANPLPFRRREVVTRMVVLQPFVDDPDALRLFDAAGNEVPFVVLDRQYVERFWGVDHRVELTAAGQHVRFAPYREHFGPRILKDGPGEREFDCYWTIQFEADLPACGHAAFELRAASSAEPAAVPAGTVTAGDGRLENDLVAVELAGDGTFSLRDRTSGIVYEGMNRLVDTADIGDEYDFCNCAAPGSERPDIIPGTVRVLGNSGLEAAVETTFTVRLPARIDPVRERRAAVHVDCPVTVRLTLRHGSPRVDVRTTVDNRAEDHRLRAVFPTPHVTDTLVSDGHFEVRRRPLVRTGGDDWTQPPPATWPQQDFSAVEADGRGLALFNRGLPEIEGVHGEEGGAELRLTLLRCVGWLSRDDFPSRRNSNAGPTLFTPEAQCLGEHVFDYAVTPYAGDWLAAAVPDACLGWRVGTPAVQGVVAGSARDGSLLEVTGGAVRVEAIKRHEDRDSLVVRMVNLGERTVEATLHTGPTLSETWRTTLLEERTEELEVGPGSVGVPMRAGEIVTIELVF